MPLEIIDLYKMFRRSKTEMPSLVSTIESNNGIVLENRIVSRLVPSPFKSLRAFSLLYECRARHGGQAGKWYVRTGADNGPPEWIWVDDQGHDDSPIPELGPAAETEIVPVSWFYDSFLVGGIILLGVVGGIAVLLALEVLQS